MTDQEDEIMAQEGEMDRTGTTSSSRSFDPSRLGLLLARPLALGWALLVAGPLSASMGLVPGLVGFGLFVLGGLFAAMVGLGGGLLVRRAGGRWGWFVLAGLLGVGVVVGPALPNATLPPINDVTTDLLDPPELDEGKALDGRGLRMDYPREFAASTAAAYPDLAPVDLSVPTGWALDAASSCLRELGGDHILRSEADGLVQATFISAVFRFRDDVVVRGRELAGGTRVDVRSKSRHGKGDLGVNARRIRKIRDCLLAKAG